MSIPCIKGICHIKIPQNMTSYSYQNTPEYASASCFEKLYFSIPWEDNNKLKKCHSRMWKIQLPASLTSLWLYLTRFWHVYADCFQEEMTNADRIREEIDQLGELLTEFEGTLISWLSHFKNSIVSTKKTFRRKKQSLNVPWIH